jgi:hypothetical protein
MNAEIVASRLRRFLLLLAGLLCLGTVAELSLLDHMDEPMQFVPFILCGLALIALLIVYLRPQRRTIWGMRLIMVAVALGGFLGVYEHLAGNQEVVMEVHKHVSGSQLLWAILTGASPVFAPGVLIVTAIVACAATYFHPALQK